MPLQYDKSQKAVENPTACQGVCVYWIAVLFNIWFGHDKAWIACWCVLHYTLSGCTREWRKVLPHN